MTGIAAVSTMSRWIRDQSHGIGAATIRAGEQWLKQRGVWKVNLLDPAGECERAGFYEQLGYEVNKVMSMGQRLIEGIDFRVQRSLS